MSSSSSIAAGTGQDRSRVHFSWVLRRSQSGDMFRLFRWVWWPQVLTERRQRMSALTVALRPALFRYWRDEDEVILTILLVRLHYVRFRQG